MKWNNELIWSRQKRKWWRWYSIIVSYPLEHTEVPYSHIATYVMLLVSYQFHHGAPVPQGPCVNSADACSDLRLLLRLSPNHTSASCFITSGVAFLGMFLLSFSRSGYVAWRCYHDKHFSQGCWWISSIRTDLAVKAWWVFGRALLYYISRLVGVGVGVDPAMDCSSLIPIHSFTDFCSTLPNFFVLRLVCLFVCFDFFFFPVSFSVFLSRFVRLLSPSYIAPCYWVILQILEYFASFNIHIMEAFGQSECTGPHTASTPMAWKMGSVGRPIVVSIWSWWASERSPFWQQKSE